MTPLADSRAQASPPRTRPSPAHRALASADGPAPRVSSIFSASSARAPVTPELLCSAAPSPARGPPCHRRVHCQPLPSVALLLETSPPEPGSAQGRCATRPARPRIAAAIPAGITLGTHAQDPRPPSFKHRPRPSAPPSHPAVPHNPSCRLASARSGAPPRPPRR